MSLSSSQSPNEIDEVSDSLSTDCLIIGAGVIGLAIAQKLSQIGREVLILEKNSHFGEENSSRNSEVIHAGIYYPKGSLKATLCVLGRKALYNYCDTHHIPYQKCGKFIVATDFSQKDDLQRIKKQAEENGVTGEDSLTFFDQDTLNRWEPEVAGVGALFSPSTGIIDSHAFMATLLREAEEKGAYLALNHQVIGGSFEKNLPVVYARDPSGSLLKIDCRYVINSAGLGAQSIAKKFMKGKEVERMVPPLFLSKGNYFSLSGAKPFKRLIYPIPTSNTLGIHATLDLAGYTRFGPDHEEVTQLNYDVDPRRQEHFYFSIRKYYPNLKETSLQPAYSGIRPQLYKRGQPPADFMIQTPEIHGLPNLIHLFGIESPGLTASLAIAENVAKRVGGA